VYKKGEIILLQDEIPRHVGIVKSGMVKTYNINKHGEERPVSIDGQSEIFPIGWVYGKIEKTQYFYEAFTDSVIIELPRKDFLQYLKFHPRMGYEMYADLAARHVALQARIYALEQSRASEKIILTLIYLCDRFAATSAGRSQIQHLKLPLTQQELENYIGLTR
jgi:CRP-like cAMP-binding protein